MDTYMTVKGQVVIPSKIRRQLGVTEGTRIQVEVEASGQRIVLTPITKAYVHGLRGKYKGKGLLKALAVEKAAERAR
ncbi:MAG: AbrB/MazE/SpoVT family DNA-binding domain-containing protein [Nevskiaceae bacterium]